MPRMEPSMVAAVIAAVGLSLVAGPDAPAQVQQPSATVAGASQGQAAVDRAAAAGKYLYVFFWKENDEQSQKMFGVFQGGMQSLADSAEKIGIQITDPNERAIVERFGLSRAPMPLVLAIAPCGVVTKGFPIQFTQQDLAQAIVSPCTAQCMKALQDRKLVVLCVANQKTQYAQAALKGAHDFRADARFAAASEVVLLNPEDPAEAGFLRDLQVDPRSPQATTVLLAPPGQPIGKLSGPVTKDHLVAKVASAQSGPCAGGQCGPGGCGPRQ